MPEPLQSPYPGPIPEVAFEYPQVSALLEPRSLSPSNESSAELSGTFSDPSMMRMYFVTTAPDAAVPTR